MTSERLETNGTFRRISFLYLLAKRGDPLRLLQEVATWPGDIAHAQIGKRQIAVLKHPDLVQQLLVTESARTEKGRTAERALFFSFLGDGLLNSRGDAHRRQRRLMLPAFHRTRIVNYGRAIVETVDSATEGWRDGDTRDLTTEMMTLTLRIVGRTIFSSGIEDSAHRITEAFGELTANVKRMEFPGAHVLLRTPLPFARRVRAAEQTLDTIVHQLIRERRARGGDTGDLLSMLLLAEDSEHPGERLSDPEVRDQVMTLLFGGHETTANVLTWTWWLLAQHPVAAEKLCAEIAQTLGGRPPTVEDLPKLIFTEQLVREVLRLYPPIWAMGRRALEDLDFNGWRVPRDTLLVASQWVNQRDARWFADPAAFRPERWTAEFRTTLPRFAYFPFGGGPRSCIGENFAWTELILVIAVLAQRWRFTLDRDAASVKPQARITLHPDRPLWLRLSRPA